MDAVPVMCRRQNSLQSVQFVWALPSYCKEWPHFKLVDTIHRHDTDSAQVLKGRSTWHLKAVSEMLPYLASGHSLYAAKSARIYLNHMLCLHRYHPTPHQQFVEGLRVAISHRAWVGLSTDLMIEQILMGSLKTSGGLTKGGCMTEQQRLTR